MIFISLILAAATPTASDTVVLTQLNAGKMLCLDPDTATKTCSEISSYAAGKGGAFVESSEFHLRLRQPLTFELSNVVQITGPFICGVLSEAGLQQGRIRIRGSLLPPDRNALILGKLIEHWKPMIGRQVCQELRVENDRLMAFGLVDQVDSKLPGKPARWIKPDDGYNVGPR